MTRECNVKCPHQTAGLCNFKTTENCERKAKAEQKAKEMIEHAKWERELARVEQELFLDLDGHGNVISDADSGL
jgi:hypothetical protein